MDDTTKSAKILADTVKISSNSDSECTNADKSTDSEVSDPASTPVKSVSKTSKPSGLTVTGLFDKPTISLAQKQANVPVTGTIVGQPEEVMALPGIKAVKDVWSMGTDDVSSDPLIEAIQEVIGASKTGIFDYDTLHMFEIRYGMIISNDFAAPCEFIKRWQDELNAKEFFRG
jgi:hypothetical protein